MESSETPSRSTVTRRFLAAAPEEAPPAKQETGDLPRMTRLQFWLCWAVVVALFFFERGPIWRRPWDIGTLNQAIFWSYLPIPILVAGCLLATRRFSLRAFFLDALELTFAKYIATFGAALILWEITPIPKAEPPPPPPAPAPAAPEPAVIPTPIDPASTGGVRGLVVDGRGDPIEGALVYIASGLEGYVFAPPAEPLAIENAGRGVVPRVAVARVGQRILARSADGHLHTFVGRAFGGAAALGGRVSAAPSSADRRGGGALFNVPLLASGQPTELRLRDAHGLVTLGCNAHPEEEEGRLLVIAHPFFDFSDRDGRVHLRGVPAGSLRVAALLRDGVLAEAALDLAPGAVADVRLSSPH